MELSRLRGPALVVGGVVLGLALALGVSSLDGDDPAEQALSRSAEVDPATLLDASDLADVDGGRTRTDQAREAVAQFLQAEKDGEAERSFALLADPLRLEYGSDRAWAADPDGVPDLLGFDVEESPADDGGRAVVVTTTRYRSSLDSVAGLVPARARTEWAVVREEGGWAVDLDATSQVPLLPPDDAATAAARTWAAAMQRCEQPAVDVRGTPALARSLCGGAVGTGTAVELPALDAGALQSAFGGDVRAWARAVDVGQPVQLRAVLAPLDDAWQVVAVLAPPGQSR